jgi:hypothetical protein
MLFADAALRGLLDVPLSVIVEQEPIFLKAIRCRCHSIYVNFMVWISLFD